LQGIRVSGVAIEGKDDRIEEDHEENGKGEQLMSADFVA